MFCTQCGHENDDSKRFCTNCGVPLRGSKGTKAADAGDGQASVSGENEPDDVPTDEVTEERDLEVEQETPEPEAEVEPESEPEAESVPEPEPSSASAPDSSPEPEAKTEPMPKTEPGAVTDPSPTPEPIPEPSPRSIPTPEPAPEPEPMPDPASEPASTPANKRSKGGLRIAAVAVVLMALAAVATFVITGGLGDDTTTVAFASDESVSVTRTARIVPTASNGTPLEHYVVRVVSATDEDGEEIDLDDDSFSVEVTGTDGFSMESIFPDLEDGTYILEIDDGTEVQTTPPIVIDEENGVSSEVQIEQTEDSGDSKSGTLLATDSEDEDETDKEDDEDTVRGADALFLEKIEELEDQYGEPSLEVTETTNASGYTYYESMLYGVVYAELVDFGDGEDRLVVMWNESADAKDDEDNEEKDEAAEEDVDENEDADEDATSTCRVEVWEYDEDADELVALLNDGDGLTPHGEYEELDYYESSVGNPLLCISTFETTDDSSFRTATETFYGLDESGAFGICGTYTTVTSLASDTVSTTYFVDSEEVSKEEYYALREEALSDSTGYFANTVFEYGGLTSADGTSDYSGLAEETDEFGVTWVYPAGTDQTVSDTIALLEERIGTVADDS